MSGFMPVVPAGGMLGWQFLNRTMESQKDAFNRASVQTRDKEYFREKIGSITSAEELVADRRLLSVALTAHGLEEDLPNRFFIRTILENAPGDSKGLTGRMADKRYAALSETFGFYDSRGPRTGDAGFADKVLASFQERSFEQVVGESAPELRIAMSIERELTTVIDGAKGNDARWFGVMGSPPLRKVFETALGLPAKFGALDLDRQLDDFKFKARAIFGTDQIADLVEPEHLEELRDRYLIRTEATNTVPASPALQILTGTSSSESILSILYS
ncbi:MAG: DUF1217 domain-containing protein [Qingshengfaniella sp.]